MGFESDLKIGRESMFSDSLWRTVQEWGESSAPYGAEAGRGHKELAEGRRTEEVS